MADILSKENIPPPSIDNKIISTCSIMDNHHTMIHTDDHHISSSSSSSSSEEPSTPIPVTIENAPSLNDLDKVPVLEEGVRWCQRCGTIETPRWRYGPGGPLT